MAVKTVELKVARRLAGVMGALEQVQAQNASQNERLKNTDALVETLNADVKAMSEAMNHMRGLIAQFDQAAQGRMDSIMANVEGLRERITTAETLFIAKAEPLPERARAQPLF